MENKLIIDGQAVPMSENQERQQQETTEQTTQVSESCTTDNGEIVTDESAEVKPDQSVEQEQDYSLQIGDEEISLTDDDSIEGQPAPQWVKDLRKGFKETQKENRELRRQLEEALAKPAEQQQSQPDAIPPKPTFESCNYDERAFEQALTDWHEEKGRVEQQMRQKQRQQQEYQQRFQQRIEAHRQRASKLPVKDYQEMEEIVRAEVPDLHKEILIHCADEGSELIAYGLGKSQQLRQRVASETDPIRAAFLLGQISQQVSLAPKPKKAIKPEPEVRGGGADAKQDEFRKLCPGAVIE